MNRFSSFLFPLFFPIIFFGFSTSVFAAPTLDQNLTFSTLNYNPRGMAVASSGVVYIVGDNVAVISPDTRANNRYVVIKVKTDGTLDSTFGTGGVVTIVPSGQSSNEARAYAVDIDDNGYVYVTGMSGFGSGNSAHTIKLNSVGGVVWNRAQTSTNPLGLINGQAIKVNPLGTAIYVAGDGVSTSTNPNLRRYDSSGNPTNLVGNIDAFGNYPFYFDMDSSGSVYFGTAKINSSNNKISCWHPLPNRCDWYVEGFGSTQIDQNLRHVYALGGYRGKYNYPTSTAYASGTTALGIGLSGFTTTTLFVVATDTVGTVLIGPSQRGGTTLIESDYMGSQLWSSIVGFSISGVDKDNANRIYVVGGGPNNIRLQRYTLTSPPQNPTSTPVSWVESIISGVTMVKKDHIQELRDWTNERRGSVGTSTFSFTDPTLSVGLVIKSQHLTEIRTAISGVYAICGQAAPTWSSGAITGGTTIRKAHIDELRAVIDAAPRCGSRKVFLSGQTYNGNLGGIAGADAKCQSLATAAGLSGTYKSWISLFSPAVTPNGASFTTSTLPTIPFTLVDGTEVAKNWNDFSDSQLSVLINKSETGTVLASSYVWTNATPSGGVQGSNQCGSWNSSSSGLTARGGISWSTTSSWSVVPSTALPCNNSYRLYCVQQ